MQPIERSTAAVTRNFPESAERKPEDDGDGSRSVDLPLHLTEKILCCIYPLESPRLAAVCESWHATVSEQLARLVPHLFVTEANCRGYVVSIPLDDWGIHGDGARLPSVVIPAPKYLNYQISHHTNCIIGTTRNGRVALATSKKVMFIDPVNGTSRAMNLGDNVTYCSPMLVGSAGEAVFHIENSRLMMRWRVQGNKGSNRTSLVKPDRKHYYFSNILSAVNCSGCIYVLHKDGRMGKVDTNATPPLHLENLEVESLADHFVSTPPLRGGYLMECEGEVVFVRQLFSSIGTITWCKCYYTRFFDTVGFEVYRSDVLGREWVKLEKLDGDCSLFVSPNSSFAVRTSKMGCRSNCIYFVGRYCLKCCDAGECTWGIYSMADGKVSFEHAIPSTTGTQKIMARWFRHIV